MGLGANAAEDAVYPVLMADADGQRLTGDHGYALTSTGPSSSPPSLQPGKASCGETAATCLYSFV